MGGPGILSTVADSSRSVPGSRRLIVKGSSLSKFSGFAMEFAFHVPIAAGRLRSCRSVVSMSDAIEPVTVFLCGDVMTGRGIDQVLPRPSDPRLHEEWLRDAREYVALAEAKSGPVPRQTGRPYFWGEALVELERVDPDARLVNLETSVTRSEDFWPGKGINYRMHPGNVGCLAAAGIDVCTLANNHVLDFGAAGLLETLATLQGAGMKTAGAGRNIDEARAPAVVDLAGGGRLIVFAFGAASSGVPSSWAAAEDGPGVDRLGDLSDATAGDVEERVRSAKGPGDIVIASIHWGSNWGYEVPGTYTRFAHRLVDGGVDVVWGHSSHHARPIEVYRDRLVLHGCGDFINDYEGITGYEEFRGDLAIMYFAVIDRESGALRALRMTPMQIRGFQLHRAPDEDALWLAETLDGISHGFGSRVRLLDGRSLELWWDDRPARGSPGETPRSAELP
jgi:poly-gamma-glutamate synthesis protein (capsule biosynthesis protein)